MTGPTTPTLSVWASGQRPEVALLREAGALAETSTDRGRVPMGVARAAILAYSRTGDTVLDPDAGSGTVLIEALHTGRHAIGITANPRLRRIGRGNIAAAKRAGAWTDATLLSGRRQNRSGPADSADLVVTALRHGSFRRDVDAEVRLDDATAQLAMALTRCVPCLRRGARVVVLAPPLHGRHGMLLDTVGAMHVAARSAGLVPDGRCVALTVPIRGRHLVVRGGCRRGRALGSTAPVHWDALVLRLPDLAVRTSAVGVLQERGRRAA